MSTIPEPTKRIVRQQAGFGCCKCGLPIFQYHHIVRGSQDPIDIMLLCPIDHHEATVRAMTEEEQRSYKNNPYNIKQGFAEGKLKINQAIPTIIIGSTKFIGQGKIICVDEEALVSVNIEHERLQLSIKLYDKNDNLVSQIMNNEWIAGNPLPWDLQAGFQMLTIRRKIGDISLGIDARQVPITIRADIWRKKQNYRIDPNEILADGVVVKASILGGVIEGYCLNMDTSKKKLTVIPRRE